MHWEILIIPLIALGVWIIGTLFKSEDDKTKKGIRSRDGFPARAPGRRPVTDLDRFLEEARRRREAEERPTPRPVPPPARVPVTRPPLRERPLRPREAPRLAPPPVPKEEVVVAVPMPRPIPPPPVAEPTPAPPLALESLVLPSSAPASARPAPVLQQVRSLLSKPQTAASAFVLREIFDRPLCKRRR
jgi:hypothetical protein